MQNDSITKRHSKLRKQLLCKYHIASCPFSCLIGLQRVWKTSNIADRSGLLQERCSGTTKMQNTINLWTQGWLHEPGTTRSDLQGWDSTRVYMERASPGRARSLWRQAKIWRESCGALYFGSDSPAGLVNVKTWKNSARLTGIPVLYCRYRGQPGWPACHVIAKLIFDVFNRHIGD